MFLHNDSSSSSYSLKCYVPLGNFFTTDDLAYAPLAPSICFVNLDMFETNMACFSGDLIML